MNTIYIIFITIIVISFVLGLFVTFFKNKSNMKIRKYNNKALQKDNYEYAKDYIYNLDEFNFSDKVDIQVEQPKLNTNINENTIVIPILSEYEEEDIKEEILDAKMYAIVDDEII